MVGSVAVGQRAAAQQLAHILGPPAFGGLRLGQEIVDRSAAADKHQPLGQQARFKDIAEPREAALGKGVIPEKSKGLQQAAAGAGLGKDPWRSAAHRH